jgi:hypothetical protein
MLRSALTTTQLLCEFCAEALLKVGKDVTEADYSTAYALYLYVVTKAQAMGGNAALEYLLDELYHRIKSVAKYVDPAKAVEDFLLSDEYRTDEEWVLRWLPIIAYLCHAIQRDCVRIEYGYGEERR